jgi:hypothetical protein
LSLLYFSITDEVERRLFNGLIHPCDRLECAVRRYIIGITIERGRFDSLSFQQTPPNLQKESCHVIFIFVLLLRLKFGGFQGVGALGAELLSGWVVLLKVLPQPTKYPAEQLIIRDDDFLMTRPGITCLTRY